MMKRSPQTPYARMAIIRLCPLPPTTWWVCAPPPPAPTTWWVCAPPPPPLLGGDFQTNKDTLGSEGQSSFKTVTVLCVYVQGCLYAYTVIFCLCPPPPPLPAEWAFGGGRYRYPVLFLGTSSEQKVQEPNEAGEKQCKGKKT